MNKYLVTVPEEDSDTVHREMYEQVKLERDLLKADWEKTAVDNMDLIVENERLHNLCHRAAKYLAASNKLSDLMRGDSQLSELYIAMVAAIHLGDGREGVT